MAFTVGELALKLSVDPAGFDSGMARAETRARGLDDIVTGAFRRVGEVATNAFLGAGAAVVDFAGQSIATARDFEQAMANVGAVSGATGADLERLTETARGLGATTSFSASQAAEGMAFLGQAGFNTNQIIDAMPGLLNAAAASGADLGRTADIVSNVLSGFSMEAGEAGRVADVLTAASVRSNTNLSQLGEAMKYAAPVANALGVSIEDTATAIGKMSDAGIQGSMAGTALRAILTRLAAPTEAAAKEMQRLGINAFDAEGKMKPLPAIVGEFSRGMEGLSDSQKAAALQTIVGMEAMSGFIALMGVGEEGLAEFSEGLSNSGGIAERVAQQQLATFEGRVKILQSALEGLQITMGSALLPVLSAVVEQGLTPLITAADQFLQVALANGDVISNVLVAGLTGLGVATTIYAATQLPVMITAVTAATTAFTAKAAAMLAALGPYALIATAVAGVAWAVNDFNTKVTTATQKLLESREWWNQSTAAVNAYNASQLQSNQTVAAAAATVETLRSTLEEQIASLGRRQAAGLVSDAQYQQEMASINSLASSLQTATAHLETQIDAAMREAAANATASAAITQLAGDHANLIPPVQLTAQEIEQLGKTIEQIYTQDGPKALNTYVQTEATFLTAAEERQAAYSAKVTELEAQMRAATSEEQRTAIARQLEAEQAAYAEQELTQAASYAEQQAAQRAHLGQMLIDYTVGQAQLGNISMEKAAEITSALETEYGLQESSTASTFLRMAGSIDDFASSSGESIDSLIGNLRDQETAAVETERAMTEMSKEYVATAVANFVEKGGEASDYAATLRAIPSTVRTEVVTVYRSEGSPSGGGGGGGGDGSGPEGRAIGGPIWANTPYIVGEEGPELVVPRSSGTVLPADQTAALLGGAGQTNNYYLTAQYGYQDERSVRDDIALLQMMQQGR